MIEPASGKEWALVMDSFIGWIERFGITPLPPVGSDERDETLAAIVRDYSTALQDLPGDLLKEAFARTIANHKWRNLPLFAEVRGYVEYELKERKHRFDKINTARFMLRHRPHVEEAPRERERLTDEQRAQVDAIMKTIRGNLQRVA